MCTHTVGWVSDKSHKQTFCLLPSGKSLVSYVQETKITLGYVTGKIETSTIVGSVRKKTGDTKQHAAKVTFVILLLGMECHMYYSLKPRLSILDFLLQLRLTFKDKRALCNMLLFTTPLRTISAGTLCNSSICSYHNIHTAPIFVTNVVIRASNFGGECGYFSWYLILVALIVTLAFVLGYFLTQPANTRSASEY